MDDRYSDLQNIFRRWEVSGRSKSITVGDCGQTTVNFSQFLSCLGFNLQETTTLTATFTETTTVSTGYTTIGVVWGCTPAGFPYVYCSGDDQTESLTDLNYLNNNEGFTFPFISMGIDEFTTNVMNVDGSISTESSTSQSSTYPTVSQVVDNVIDMPTTSSADPDKVPTPISSISSTVSGQSSVITFLPVPETTAFFNSTLEHCTENSPSTFPAIYPPHFQTIYDSTTHVSSTTDSAEIHTLIEVSNEYPPTFTTAVPETVDYGNITAIANSTENNYSTDSTVDTAEIPIHTTISTITVFGGTISNYPPVPVTENYSTINSHTSTTNESHTYPFTTVSDEIPISSTYSTVSSETIDYGTFITVNTVSDVAAASPVTLGDSTIYLPVSETVVNNDTTEEGLT